MNSCTLKELWATKLWWAQGWVSAHPLHPCLDPPTTAPGMQAAPLQLHCSHVLTALALLTPAGSAERLRLTPSVGMSGGCSPIAPQEQVKVEKL